MRELGPGIWLHESPGVPAVDSRAIVRLSSGGLWIHSPPMLTPDLKDELAALGTVEAIVAPNNTHSQFIEAWRDAYPDSRCYVARGIPVKRPALERFELIEDVAVKRWPDDFDIAVMHGVPLFDECVFLHRPSRTLIVTDLIQHYPPHTSLLGKFFFGPIGYKGLCQAPPILFDFIVHDRQALMNFLDVISQWQFDRIVVTHGTCVEQNAKEVFDSIHLRIRTQRGSALQALLLRLMLSLLVDGGIPKKA